MHLIFIYRCISQHTIVVIYCPTSDTGSRPSSTHVPTTVQGRPVFLWAWTLSSGSGLRRGRLNCTLSFCESWAIFDSAHSSVISCHQSVDIADRLVQHIGDCGPCRTALSHFRYLTTFQIRTNSYFNLVAITAVSSANIRFPKQVSCPCLVEWNSSPLMLARVAASSLSFLRKNDDRLPSLQQILQRSTTLASTFPTVIESYNCRTRIHNSGSSIAYSEPHSSYLSC